MSHGRVALAGLFLAMPACTSMRSVRPAQFIPQNSPEVVWVTYTNHPVVPLAQPEIAGDTLRGVRLGTRERVVIPLGQVGSVRAKEPDHVKTVLFLSGLGVAAVSAVYFVFVRQAGPSTDGVVCGYDKKVDPIPYC